MKIKVVEIKADANELRASNTVADGILGILRRTFNPYFDLPDDDPESEEDSESEEGNDEGY